MSDHKLKKPKKFSCQYCYSGFTRKDNLERHLNKGCKLFKTNQVASPVSSKEKVITLDKDLTEKSILIDVVKKVITLEKDLKEKSLLIEELQKKPSINNQILQVVCVGSNDNYLDMLTQEYGNFDKALAYIKDCALSSLIGDCKLIEKIYFDQEKTQPSIRYIDKKKSRIEYLNEKNEKIQDSKELLGRKLANNLQNSYLKGVNYLITKNLEMHGCPNKFLEEYDLQIWNQHIYDLSDCQYQRKFINHLNIPH